MLDPFLIYGGIKPERTHNRKTIENFRFRPYVFLFEQNDAQTTLFPASIFVNLDFFVRIDCNIFFFEQVLHVFSAPLKIGKSR